MKNSDIQPILEISGQTDQCFSIGMKIAMYNTKDGGLVTS